MCLPQPLHHSLDDSAPYLRSEACTALQHQTLQDEGTFAILVFCHGAAIVLQGGNGGEGHLDDGLHCCWVAVEYVAAVVDEQLEGVEGMAEPAGILVVEDLRNYLKHPLLVGAHSFSPIYEGSILDRLYVSSMRMSSS